MAIFSVFVFIAYFIGKKGKRVARNKGTWEEKGELTVKIEKRIHFLPKGWHCQEVGFN